MGRKAYSGKALLSEILRMGSGDPFICLRFVLSSLHRSCIMMEMGRACLYIAFLMLS